MDLDLNLALFYFTSLFLIVSALYIVRKATSNRLQNNTHPQQQYTYNYDPVQPQVIPPEAIKYLNRENPPWIQQIPQLQSQSRSLKLEIELPELPERVRIGYDKLPELLRLLETYREEPLERGRGVGRGENIGREGPGVKGGIHQVEEAPNTRGGVDTYSFIGHHRDPWIDIISKVSGLEFSGDGKRVYCPRHGWVNYIVTSDGRILCGYDYHILFDPNKPKTYPVKALKKMKKELQETMNEIQELRDKASMTISSPPLNVENVDVEEEGEDSGEEEEDFEEEE